MDFSAIDLCRRNGIPIVVFNLKIAGHMREVVLGRRIGTLVGAGR
jgi:uridylate kinase